MTYSKQADADIERIDRNSDEWALRAGAYLHNVRYYAAKADAERVRCEHIKRNPRDWVPEFFAHATHQEILLLMLELHDQFTSRRNYLNDAPMCDLSGVLTEVEDAIFEYDNSREREAEARAEAMELHAECRHDDEMIAQWEDK